jgi:hypothetical protein
MVDARRARRSVDVDFTLAVQRRKPIDAQDLFHAAGGAQQRHLVEAAGHELHRERQSVGADAAGQADRRPTDQGPRGLERRIAGGLGARGEVRRRGQQEGVDLGRELERFCGEPPAHPLRLQVDPAR